MLRNRIILSAGRSGRALLACRLAPMITLIPGQEWPDRVFGKDRSVVIGATSTTSPCPVV